jgi:hypothetical protein
MTLNEVLLNQTEIFMDVQDLVLQWVFLRSFETRPQLTTYFINFLSGIMEKYSGANLFLEEEKFLLVTSSIYLYINCNRYVNLSYFSILFRGLVTQVGSLYILKLIEVLLKENEILDEFHSDHILAIIQEITKFISPMEVSQAGSTVALLIQMVYAQKNNTTTMLSLQILSSFHLRAPHFVENFFQNSEDQALIAIQTLSQQLMANDEGAELQAGMMSHQMTRNEDVELPKESVYEDEDDGLHQEASENGDDGMDDSGALKIQIDTLLRELPKLKDYETQLQYLEYLSDWLGQPEMETFLVKRANELLTVLLAIFQNISQKLNLNHADMYLVMTAIFEKMSDNDTFVKALKDEPLFEFFDTVSLF